MTSTQQISALAAANCDVAFDNLTRQLYATDASLYQVEPVAVAFPRGTKQACSILHAASEAGISIIPRGAGTGLAGGALGEGLIVDFARHNRHIMDLDLEKRTVRVGAGVVLDQLNQFLRPHALRFGPDVATSSRATLGGMIANNSSGSHTPYFGTTSDHVVGLDLVLSDGKFARVGENYDTLPHQRDLIEDIVHLNSVLIDEQCPPGLLKRRPGYALDRCLRKPGNLVQVICGSEGTLAAIVAAELKLVPVPSDRGLGLIFFDSVVEAMQATVDLLDLKPAAIEHMDRILLDQTKGQLEFRGARDLLELDGKPCESMLAVEFFEDAPARLAELNRRRLGVRKRLVQTQTGAELVWSLRKAGLSLLTGRKGPAKPIPVIEDAAVRPEQLPAYVSELRNLLAGLGVEASFYGHAGAGLLHVRPVLDLRSRGDVKKLRQIAHEVSVLVRNFKGSLAAEHGVGIARTEFMQEQVGEGMMGLMRQIKDSFDPHDLMNPGKIIPDGRYEVDADLRTRPGHELELPFEPVLGFVKRDESFAGNLEQCNGCGGCLKQTPAMCPTYIAAGEEILSTRGRANAIRAALERRGLNSSEPLESPELEAALSGCLSCKACTTECPSNVNLALLKAELQHAQIRKEGLSVRQRLFCSLDFLGRMGCKLPRVSNLFLQSSIMRFLGARVLGITARRNLPRYARVRFDHWFARRSNTREASRGRVVLWDDTFVRYHEPDVGMAAVAVLESAGFRVELPAGRKCCGRPAFSQGNLDEVVSLGRHNLELLSRDVDEAPILFLEPSCFSMFAEDYLELKLPNAAPIARRCFLFEDFIEQLLQREPNALSFNRAEERILIHVHCHVKSMMPTEFMRKLGERLPGRTVELANSGCCGMAGAFGALESKYDLSIKVAEPLIREVKAQPFGTTVVTSGTSCRSQVTHLATVKARHMAEVLAEALVW